MRENGKIDYVEMPAGDLPTTKAFYGAAFGWTFTDYGPEYAAMSEGLDGGFYADPADAVAKPLVILYATDLEAMEAKITAAGGTIVRPAFSFPGGRRFHFADPSGNELAVWAE
jgi:predicted enzyme related to lactoylglutathione lyase